MTYDLLKLRIKSLECRCEVMSDIIERQSQEIERLIRYSDYLAISLDKSISFTEYGMKNIDNIYQHFPEIEPCDNFKDLLNL
jgi:hypothetical protein